MWILTSLLEIQLFRRFFNDEMASLMWSLFITLIVTKLYHQLFLEHTNIKCTCYRRECTKKHYDNLEASNSEIDMALREQVNLILDSQKKISKNTCNLSRNQSMILLRFKEPKPADSVLFRKATTNFRFNKNSKKPSKAYKIQ